MSTFTLDISCLTTSNLPWFMDLILLFTASNLASITSHIHNWILFLLWLHPFILSGVISPLISSSLLGTYRPGEFIFQCPIFLPFHTVHGVLKARILKWFAILFSSPCQTRVSWIGRQIFFLTSESPGKPYYWVLRVLWMSRIPPLSDTYFENTFHSVCGSSIHFLNDVFWWAKVLNLDQSISLSFMVIAFSVLRNFCLYSSDENISLFSSRSFIVLDFTFKFKVLLE